MRLDQILDLLGKIDKWRDWYSGVWGGCDQETRKRLAEYSRVIAIDSMILFPEQHTPALRAIGADTWSAHPSARLRRMNLAVLEIEILVARALAEVQALSSARRRAYGPNWERDQFIYRACAKGETYKQILAKVNATPGWERLSTVMSLKRPRDKYAKLFMLPSVAARKGGRPKK
jgi:hypothetical protein